MSESLPCPRCGGPSDLATWLDSAEPKLAPAGCLRARCPRCEGEAHLALRSGEAAIGTLSSSPAMFRPERRANVAGLDVITRFDGLRVALERRGWVFEA